MSPNELIDEVLQDRENVDPLDADNVERRLRFLHFLLFCNSYVHNFREWEWTYKEGFITAALPTDNFIVYPADFLELGKQGNLYNPITGRPIAQLSRARISQYRRLPGASGQNPYMAYAIWDGGFQFIGAIGGTTIPMFYRRIADTMTEPTDPLLMPDKYVRVTLQPALEWRVQNMKNDDRESWAATMQAGLAQLCAMEQPLKNARAKMPMAIRGAW